MFKTLHHQHAQKNVRSKDLQMIQSEHYTSTCDIRHIYHTMKLHESFKFSRHTEITPTHWNWCINTYTRNNMNAWHLWWLAARIRICLPTGVTDQFLFDTHKATLGGFGQSLFKTHSLTMAASQFQFNTHRAVLMWMANPSSIPTRPF